MVKFFCIIFLFIPFKFASVSDIKGQQPNVAIDTKGVVRMVYGDGESIYCQTSTNNGLTFSKPVLVGQLTGMHLGHSRGPQIASSANYTLITAITKDGNIHSFRLNHAKGVWTKLANANDKDGSAPEGLMSLAADQQDNFYAAWLDTRSEKKNNLYFASMNGSTWAKNIMIYKSPDEHICECCRPNVSLNGSKLVIGFRNWLMGSRDIYYSISSDKGKTFTAPKKSGTGTWQLNACPMDGGSISINETGKVSTAWRRNGDVIYWSESRPEQKVGSGKDVSMIQNKARTVIAWQDDGSIKVLDLNKKETSEIGNGVSPRVYLLNNGKIICVWEDNERVRYKVI
jgi:hypothetical protein